MDTISESQRQFAARLAIGLVQGLVLYLLYSASEAQAWPATQGAVFAPLLLTGIFIPLLLIQALGEMPPRRVARWAAVATAVLVALAFFDNWMAWPWDWQYGGLGAGNVTAAPHAVPHIIPSPQLFIFGGGALFIAHALVVGAAHDRRFMARYPIHFDIAWKLAVQLALAGLFVGAFWLLLWLGAGLFNLIKLNFFEKLITHEWFAIPALTLAAAGALHLTDIRPALVQGARTLLLTLLSWLLPVIALITVGFVASLPFTGLSALWSIGHATALLLAAAAALIVLINAAHQDGAAERMPPRILQLSGSVAAVLTLPLALIAGYALTLRVGQYGWTVDRVTVAAIVIVALAYAGGYARAALARGPWLRRIETWNFLVSLLALALVILLFTPLASPTRIAVNDQMARLHAGKIAPQKFDFAFLRNQGGHYGQAALNELAHSADAYTRHAAQRILDEKPWRNTPVTPQALAERMTVYPRGQQLPQSFLKTDWTKAPNRFLFPACLGTQTQHCDAILADLDGDGHDEILLRADSMVEVYRETPGGWRQVGHMILPGNCPKAVTALQNGSFTLQPPPQRWNDLVIGGLTLHLRENTPLPDQPVCPH